MLRPWGGSMIDRLGERRSQVVARELNGPEIMVGLVGHWKNLGFDPEDMRNHWGLLSRETT